MNKGGPSDSPTFARGLNEPQILITQAENSNSLQSFRSSLLRLSSADDAEQTPIPFDIRALFDQQAKERPSNPRDFARQTSIFSDYSNIGEVATFPGSFGSLHDTLANLNAGSTQPGEPYATPQPDNRLIEVNTGNRLVRTSPDFNKTCPYCCVTMNQESYDTSKFTMFAGYSSRRQYLAHRECQIRSNIDPKTPKLIGGFPLTQPKVQFSRMPISPPLQKNFVRKDKDTYFLSFEGYHPISSYLYFKVERICHIQQNTLDNKEILHMDLATKSTNIFEPASYTIPWDEFRFAVSFHSFNADDEPYRYEFMIDLSNIPSLPNNEHTYAEVQYSHGGNNIVLSLKISQNDQEENEASGETKSKFQPFFSSTSPPKDLDAIQKPKTKSISVTFKQFSASLPLQRISTPIKLHWNNESVNMRVSPPVGNTSPNMHQKKVESPNGQTFLSSFLGSPFYETKALNQKVIKPISLASLNAGNSTNNTSKGPLGTHSNSSNDYGSYFAFASVRGDRLRAATCKLPPPQNNFYSRQPSLGDPEEYFMKNDDSPLLEATNSRQLNMSPVKQNSPGHLWVIDQRDASVSENFSLSKVSGAFYPTTSTLGSFENETTGSRTMQSLAGFELEEHFQAAQYNPKPESIKETDEFFQLDQYLGKLDQSARSYQGSKDLQQFITRASPQEIDLIVSKISQNIQELMLDPYANYMIQTLIQNCSPEQRYMLLQKIAPSMVEIACHNKGTHSLQVIVPLMSREAELQLIREAFKNRIPELAIDTYATHVIQKLITVAAVEDIAFIYEPLLQNFLKVAMHSYGILVIKHLMAKIDRSPNLKQRIVVLIFDEFERLIQDQHGNYTIQYALEYYPNECEPLLEKILVRVISYSSQKFSSTVIEKCLTNANTQYLKRVVNEIMKGDRLPDLMKNKYGNYVLLHVLLASEQEERERVMQGISKHTNQFHGTKYKQRWSSFLEENPLNIEWSGCPSGTGIPVEEGSLMKQIEEDFPTEASGASNRSNQGRLKEADLEKIKKVWRNWNRREKKDGQKSPESTNSKQALSFENAMQMNPNHGYNNDYQQQNYSSSNYQRNNNKKTWNKGKKDSKGKNDRYNNNSGWHGYNK